MFKLYKNSKAILCTLSALVFSVNSVHAIPNKVNERELTAAVLVAEAGGSGITDMKAVFEVIRTRMKQKQVSMYRIVTEKYAFSSFNKWHRNPQAFINKYKRHALFVNALWIVDNYKGTELTRGSNFYHEKNIKPFWSRGIAPRAVINNHYFFALIY